MADYAVILRRGYLGLTKGVIGMKGLFMSPIIIGLDLVVGY